MAKINLSDFDEIGNAGSTKQKKVDDKISLSDFEPFEGEAISSEFGATRNKPNFFEKMNQFRQMERDEDKAARSQVLPVAATMGLGAAEEVAKWVPNAANFLSFGQLDLARPEGGFTQFSPIEDKDLAQDVASIGGLIPHAYLGAQTLGSNFLSKLGSSKFLPGLAGEAAKVGTLEALLADPGEKIDAAKSGVAGTAIAYTAGSALSRLLNKGPTPKEVHTKRVQEARQAEANLKEEKMLSEQTLKDMNTQTAEKLAQESILRQRAIEETQERLRNLLPQGEEARIGELSSSLKGARKEIQDAYKNMYDAFDESVGAVTDIKTPVVYEKVKSFIKDESIPKPIRNRLERIAGREEFVPKHMEAATLTYVPDRNVFRPPTHTKVSDYMDAHKRVTSEAHKFLEDSKNPNLTLREADALRAKAKKYFRIADAIDESVVGSITPTQQAEYQSIKDFFRDYEVPFRTTPMLKSATARDPQLKQKDFFGGLTRENKPALRERLTQDPRVRQATERHDLMDMDFGNPRDIERALSGDRGRALTDPVRNNLEQLQQSMSNKADVDKILQTVGTEELAFLKKYPELEGIFQRRPDLRHPFDTAQKESKRLEKLKKELVRAGMERKSAEIAMREYKQKVRGIGGMMSILLGPRVYFGSKAFANFIQPQDLTSPPMRRGG